MGQYHLLTFSLCLKIHHANGSRLKVTGVLLCSGVKDFTTGTSWTSLSKLVQLCTVGRAKQCICFHNPCIVVTYGFSWKRDIFLSPRFNGKWLLFQIFLKIWNVKSVSQSNVEKELRGLGGLGSPKWHSAFHCPLAGLTLHQVNSFYHTRHVYLIFMK